MRITGFHHITLVTRDAAANVAYWERALGMRLVKKTVNFDDPGSCHLYFGDRLGRPGTAVTFFEWLHAAPGRPGIGGTLDFTLGLEGEALGDLAERLRAAGREVSASADALELRDPDGTRLRVVAASGPSAPDDRPSGAERWRPGLREIAFGTARLAAAEAFYAGALGLEIAPLDAPGRLGFHLGDPAMPQGLPSPRLAAVELDPRSTGQARHGAGQTHHFALAVSDAEVQLAFRERLLSLGLAVSPVMDRVYFRSIYTRDPDGHIVELATAGPGFAVDESEAALGGSLRLPPWLESRRAEIEPALAPIGSGPAVAR